MPPTLPPFADIIEQAPDGVVIVDADGLIVFVNARITDMFGFSADELIRQPIEMLLPPRFRRQHAGHRGLYAGAPRVRPMGDARSTFLGARVDGSEFPVEIQLAPVQRGAQRWTLAFVRDASERRLILDELERSRRAAQEIAKLKAEFLSIAAHDLSQPVQTVEFVLSSIQSHSEMPSDVASLVEGASSSLARMRELLKMLLDISRIESGTIQVLELAIQVADIFGDLERQFGTVARAKQLSFHVRPCSRVLVTDPTLLRALLSNLTSNAIRYTPRGEVSVECEPTADGGVRLAVQDSGIGITREETQLIFNDFYRSSDTKSAHPEGFGLGLGIVKRLSKLLAFPVTVDSVVGRGSTFAVHIPKEKVQLAPPLQ